ncbi:hypothetical protein HanIR_Chr03g0134841 [Helianthus annuus]|nr:hypothetical protein HanIR_Chr03g0134841 [Helianthus annuus]
MRWEKIIFHEKLKRVSGYTVLSGKGGSAPITDHRQVCLPFNITDFGGEIGESSPNRGEGGKGRERGVWWDPCLLNQSHIFTFF